MNQIQQYILSQITNEKVRTFYIWIVFFILLIIGLINQFSENKLGLAYLNYIFVLISATSLLINKSSLFSSLTKVNFIVFIIFSNILISNIICLDDLMPSFYWFIIVPLSAMLLCDMTISLIWTFIVLVVLIIYSIFVNIDFLLIVKNKITFNNYFFDQMELMIVSIIILYYINQFHKTLLTKLVQTNFDLNEASLKLKESQQYKDLFFANISHEIRTPLNSIIGYATLLKEKNKDQEDIQSLDTIHYSSKLLLTIINDILDISKLNANKFSLSESGYNLQKSLHHIYDLFKQEADECNLKLSIYFSDNFPEYAVFDSVRVSQIVINLVKNAIKFTKNGSITINCNLKENDILSIEIIDTGIGISKEYLEKIFTNYTQENDYISQKYGGSGLGLSIAYKLANLMKGSIVCKSVKGKGSTFTFEFPYKFSEKIDDEIKEIHLTEKFKQLKIIIADDNQINLVVTKKLLLQKYPEQIIAIAENGEDVLSLLEKDSYDIVLMDLQMPILDGIETTKKIRETNNIIKIIALTAGINEILKEKCYEAGMNDYIYKPFEMDELVEKINHLFS